MNVTEFWNPEKAVEITRIKAEKEKENLEAVELKQTNAMLSNEILELKKEVRKLSESFYSTQITLRQPGAAKKSFDVMGIGRRKR